MGSPMDVVSRESSPARSQPCLSQQVFNKTNKKASPVPNKQTFKSQVEKKETRRGGNEYKSRVDAAGGLAGW